MNKTNIKTAHRAEIYLIKGDKLIHIVEKSCELLPVKGVINFIDIIGVAMIINFDSVERIEIGISQNVVHEVI